MNNKRKVTVATVLLAVTFGVGAVKASEYLLDVDGTTYQPTKTVGNGSTHHFDTPDVNPTFAFTDRNVWTGNGSENLPCEGGIHWIDNKNLLTISHCLEVPPVTTTTVPPTTTTTEPPETTTTTEPPTATTVPPVTTTTLPPTPTTTEPTGEELPLTGSPLVPFTAAGGLLLILGGATVYAARKTHDNG